MYLKMNNIKGIENQKTDYILVIDDKMNKMGEQLYQINKDAVEIIKLLNGTKTVDEIVAIITENNNGNYAEAKENLLNFLKVLDENLGLQIEKLEKPSLQEIPILGDGSTQYPSVLSIEITHKCNAKCLHCYGEYSVGIQSIDNTNEIKKVLREAKNAGTRVIEFTGGEVTSHKNFTNILEYAYELEFSLVSILSNGIYWSNELLSIVKENKDKTVVQIDLHGDNDDYINWFMGTNIKGITNKIKKNIKTIHDFGVAMRVVKIMTPKNIEQLMPIADWLKSIGMESYGLSVVIPMGRADKDDKNGLLLRTEEHSKKVNEMIEKIYKKYDTGFLYEVKDGDIEKLNCGAFTSNPSITPEGSIKFCAMDDGTFIKSIGNAFEEDIKDIFTNNTNIINIIKNMRAPNYENDECINCEHKFFCTPCIIRGLKSAKEIGYNNCYWFKNNIPAEFRELIL